MDNGTILVILFLFANMGISSTIYLKLGGLDTGQRDMSKNMDVINTRLAELEKKYNKLEIQVVGWLRK